MNKAEFMRKRGYVMKKGYMKQSEIAEVLGVSRPTVYRFIKDNDIQADLIDGQTNLYSQEKALKIIDAYRELKSGVQPSSLNDEQGEQVKNEPVNNKIEQVTDWKMIAEIYKEQLDQANDNLNKALDSLNKEQETKQMLLAQLEQKEPEQPKKGFWARLFNA